MLIPFYVSKDVNYILDFEHKSIRVFHSYGQVITESGDVYEIKTDYLSDEVDDIKYCQNGDVLYLFHKNHNIHTLKRYDTRDWRLEKFETKYGPWDSVNTSNKAMKVSVAGSEEITVITADGDVFNDTDVGRLIRLTVVNSNEEPWQAEKEFASGQIVKSDNKYYKNVSGTKSGVQKPVHTEGEVSDGGIIWKYLHSGYGTLRIKEYISPTSVNAYVLDYIPDSLANDSTQYWELGLIHAGGEYPVCGTFYRNRFCFMVNDKGIPKVCMSCSDDYDNFADKENGEVLATNAITVPVTSNKYNKGMWLCASDVLFVGTSSAEFYIDSATSAEAMSSDNVQIKQISEIGSSFIQPVKIGAHILFVTATGNSIRDIIYSYVNDSYDPIDLSLYGKHLLSSGIKKMTYQEYPDKIVWFAVNDGRLIGFTFSSEQTVQAMHQHNLGGKVEDLAVIPSYEYNIEDLWLIVDRNGARCIEYLDNGMPYELPEEISNISDIGKRERNSADYIKKNSVYLDSCIEGNFKDNETISAGFTFTERSFRNEVVVYTKDESKKFSIGVTGDDYYIKTNFNLGDYFDSGIKSYEVVMGWSVSEFLNPYVRILTSKNLPEKVFYTIYLDGKIIEKGITQNHYLDYKLTGLSFVPSNVLVYFSIPFEETRIIKGLEHLEGKMVSILADGAELERQLVQSGQITIPRKYVNVKIGLPFESEFIPQNLYIQGNNGSGVGDVQRIDHITLMLYNSMGGKVGSSFDNLQDIYFRKTDDKMDESSPLFTGNKKIMTAFNTSTIKEKGATMVIYNDSVFPMNILAISPHFTTSGNGL